MNLKPGHKSSEFWKALWAQLLGSVLTGYGAKAAVGAQSIQQAGVAVALAAIGACVLVRALEAYAGSRGNVKAAAVRRNADSAPRQL